MNWLRRLFDGGGRSDGPATAAGGRGPQRTSGAPPSGNGASSMHLFWSLPGQYAAAEVTLEVIQPPRVAELYFWAFQATFSGGGRPFGGAHLGLQWHPQYPGGTAVNWGGYRHGGGELDGSASSLPSALGNPHTRDYRWAPGVPYRLRIDRSPTRPGSWRGSLFDPERQAVVAVRELHAGGTHLTSLMTWSEVFARCEDPPATVRWSDPVAFDDAGRAVPATEVTVNYQSYGDGGCSNTTCFADDVGICQRTATARATPQGRALSVPVRR